MHRLPKKSSLVQDGQPLDETYNHHLRKKSNSNQIMLMHMRHLTMCRSKRGKSVLNRCVRDKNSLIALSYENRINLLMFAAPTQLFIQGQ